MCWDSCFFRIIIPAIGIIYFCIELYSIDEKINCNQSYTGELNCSECGGLINYAYVRGAARKSIQTINKNYGGIGIPEHYQITAFAEMRRGTNSKSKLETSETATGCTAQVAWATLLNPTFTRHATTVLNGKSPNGGVCNCVHMVEGS